MITPPADWARYAGAHVLRLEPPGGGGAITYRERLPIRRFGELVDDLVADEPQTVRGTIERLVTAEGEHAAWTALEAAGHRRWIGAIFLDDTVAVLDACSLVPRADTTIEKTARWLLVHASFGLGVRPRRFQYDVPAGWWGVPSGLSTTWYPPGFPRRRAMIVVPPAEPSREGPATAFAELLADEVRRSFTLTDKVLEHPLPARDGLTGALFRYRGRWLHDPAVLDHRVVVLTDGSFRYVLRLEVVGIIADEEAAALDGLARSVASLPRPGRSGSEAIASRTALSDPWVD